MNCVFCGCIIPAERLKALPDTRRCVKCAAIHPEPPKFDPNEVCAKSSPSGQNGFSPKD